MNAKDQRLLDLYDEIKDIDAVHRYLVSSNEAEEFEFSSRAAIRARLRDLLQKREEARPPAKQLFIDIETAPMSSLVWSMWNNNLSKDHLLSDWYMLTWAAAWNHDRDNIFGRGLQHFKGAIDNQNDKPLLEELWELLEEADVVIAHNGNRFDVPKINTRFLIHSMIPPSPYQTIDTLQILKRKLKFSSNRLDFVSRQLGHQGKDDNDGMALWHRCCQGDKKAFNDMLSYNKGDIRELMDVHDDLRPWLVSGPNIAMIEGRGYRACTSCGSHDLTKTNTPYRTTAGEYVAWRCNDCGTISRERRTAVPASVKDNLLRPIAR